MNPLYAAGALRAQRRCEYCRAPEDIFNFHFEIDHIFPVALGGTNDPDNLALACPACNLYKSNALTSFDADTQADVPQRTEWASGRTDADGPRTDCATANQSPGST